jgi:hypothetical protein
MPEQLAVGTPRLELVPCSLSVANALSDDVEEGGRLLDARLPKKSGPILSLRSSCRSTPNCSAKIHTCWDTAAGSSSSVTPEPSSDPPAFKAPEHRREGRNRLWSPCRLSEPWIRHRGSKSPPRMGFRTADREARYGSLRPRQHPAHRVVEKAGLTRRGVQPDGRIRFETSGDPIETPARRCTRVRGLLQETRPFRSLTPAPRCRRFPNSCRLSTKTRQPRISTRLDRIRAGTARPHISQGMPSVTTRAYIAAGESGASS